MLVDDTDVQETALRADGVTRSYGAVAALDSVRLDIRSHTIQGLIGPNGAGKSTLVNIISGYDRPDAGRIELDGRDITRDGPARRARHGIARTFQHGRLFNGLSVRENVEVAALGTGTSARRARLIGSELLDVLGLAAAADRPAAALPHGNARRLGVARALATSPRYLLLDEPAAGLNEEELDDFSASIRAVRDARGVGVLLIDHNMRLIFALCDRIHVLVHGKSLFEGSAQEIRSHPEVQTAYLGVSGSTS